MANPIGSSDVPVYVDEHGHLNICTNGLHAVTVTDKGDPEGPLLATIYIDGVPNYIHDKVIGHFVVAFVDYDGRNIESKSVLPNTEYSSIVKPSDPSREGYRFTGWSDPDPVTSVVDGKVVGNCVITAKYEEELFTVTYYSVQPDSGGYVVETRQLRRGEIIPDIGKPHVSSAESPSTWGWKGWMNYSGDEIGSPIAQDSSFYGKWCLDFSWSRTMESGAGKSDDTIWKIGTGPSNNYYVEFRAEVSGGSSKQSSYFQVVHNRNPTGPITNTVQNSGGTASYSGEKWPIPGSFDVIWFKSGAYDPSPAPTAECYTYLETR